MSIPATAALPFVILLSACFFSISITGQAYCFLYDSIGCHCVSILFTTCCFLSAIIYPLHLNLQASQSIGAPYMFGSVSLAFHHLFPPLLCVIICFCLLEYAFAFISFLLVIYTVNTQTLIRPVAGCMLLECTFY